MGEYEIHPYKNQEYLEVPMFREEKGSAALTTPIIIAISVFLLAILLVFSINILMPYIWYDKLSSYSMKYIFIMEEYGYLTPVERSNLSDELKSVGFDESRLTITATEKIQDYGSPIFLNISYKYNMILPRLLSGSLATVVQGNIVDMNVRRQSVSKR